MQDAVLIYYMMANLLHAGYFADIAKVVQQAVTQLRVAVAGLRNSRSAGVRARSQATDFMPAACREFEDWVARLTRMESYVLSMR
jgi:hypothetical protein